ncbi:hypothetical protein SBV1_1300015 [Verrucomicrobia bacterium]|nr:hypothetical protein SBV1_1300015 [Verrucomicrobiota bacterium]
MGGSDEGVNRQQTAMNMAKLHHSGTRFGKGRRGLLGKKMNWQEDGEWGGTKAWIRIKIERKADEWEFF